jgi:hypothetical protein
LLTAADEDALDSSWREAIEDRATIAWQGITKAAEISPF